MGKKYTYEEVKKKFKDEGCKLLSKKYINCLSKLDYICNCGKMSSIKFSSFLRGHRCRECGIKKQAKSHSFTFKYVKKYFEDNKCQLLSKNYINANTNMLYLCENNHLCKVKFIKFKSGGRCAKCAKNQKYSLKEVKKIFKNEGCELLETEYKNNHIPMKFRCVCGFIGKINLTSFKKGCRCKKCGTIKMVEKQKHSFKYVKNYFEKYNYKLLEDIYKNARILMKCKCDNEHIYKTTFENFRSGRRCRKCVDKKNSGKNHFNYNFNLTKEERITKRNYPEYKEWRKLIYKKDNYTCQYCRDIGHELNVHHIESYANNIDLRVDINNGVTLCKNCHNLFHKIYTRKNNTREQYNEFMGINKIKEIYNGISCNRI